MPSLVHPYQPSSRAPVSAIGFTLAASLAAVAFVALASLLTGMVTP